jgi:hypothetical protein
MAVTEKLTPEQQHLIAPLEARKDWAGLMNKQLAQLVLDGKAESREVADFVLARLIRKVA